MHRLTNFLLFAFFILTMGLMVLKGQPASLDWWKTAVGFIAWTCVPYAVLWVLNNIVIEEEPRRDWVLLTATMAVCMFAVMMLWQSFRGSPTEIQLAHRLAAVYAKMPLWQSGIALLGGLIAFALPKKAAG